MECDGDARRRSTARALRSGSEIQNSAHKTSKQQRPPEDPAGVAVCGRSRGGGEDRSYPLRPGRR